MTPQRIQRRRTRGWKMPPNTICVTRGTKWDNPFKGSNAVDLFRAWLLGTMPQLDWSMSQIHPGALFMHGPKLLARIEELRGKNLACWCAPGQPCHADVLLKIANKEQTNDRMPTIERRSSRQHQKQIGT